MILSKQRRMLLVLQEKPMIAYDVYKEPAKQELLEEAPKEKNGDDSQLERCCMSWGCSSNGKVITKWKFEKDGTPITMRDVTNNSKGSQLDTYELTFLELDDNKLCRWDMKDRHNIVKQLSSLVLNWAA
eukprot:Gb_11198 [translate_table: standard]